MSRLLADLYCSKLALHTDLYQLTSAYALWKSGKHATRACYYMFHRMSPFGGGYAVAAGLQYVTDWMKAVYFEPKELGYLSELRGNDGQPLFGDEKFLRYLEEFRFRCELDAVPEGTVVFPHEPMLRVVGTMVECLLAETFILNVVNSQTLFATKASRVRHAAGTDPVMEFGLRRAQGIDGGIAASRAAFIGGADATSNVQAAWMFDLPTKGTHPHGFVMFHDSEQEAFDAYADAMPNNCVFLVDTYDTLRGVERAAGTSRRLLANGHKPIGIRLDSGDLAYLSIEARKILDGYGLQQMKIFASNDLDERIITSLKQQGAKIDVWGVGTKLSTAYDQPAFGGVFKMSAVQMGGQWQRRIKLSDNAIKTSNPGLVNTVRFKDVNTNMFVGDAIIDELVAVEKRPTNLTIIDPFDVTRRKTFEFDVAEPEPLLVRTMTDGQMIIKQPSLAEMKRRAEDQLSRIHPTIRRFDNPHTYPVGLEKTLYDLKYEMIIQAKGVAQ